MNKSFVTMEQNICEVCGQSYDTGAILLDKKLREKFDSKTITGLRGMCEEHEKLYEDGYIALIEVKNVSTTEKLKQEEADRTGTLVHIKKEAFEGIFNQKAENNGVMLPMAFVQQEVIDYLEKLKEENDK